MIGFLKGRLLHKQPPHLAIDVSGVGYEVEATMGTFYQLPAVGEDVQIYTHLVVREDAQLLFGFASQPERSLFRTLIKVNGVGAKMALTILSGIEADEFTRCIMDSNADRLVKLPGIGKKTAERLIVEMRDRLKDWELEDGPAQSSPNKGKATQSQLDEAISALISLGYKPQEASRFVQAVVSEEMDSETIIREALKASAR
ncbi:MAG: Holliday junction branch migration protein RuvA [Gammaproteobacteria bacterium]|nr:Holliday junction branch migration protein RuvA [Gammaproteobacteria bacterium]